MSCPTRREALAQPGRAQLGKPQAFERARAHAQVAAEDGARDREQPVGHRRLDAGELLQAVVQLLLDKGAKVDAKDKFGYTPLS